MNPAFKVLFWLFLVGLLTFIILSIDSPFSGEDQPVNIISYQEAVPNGFSAPDDSRVFDMSKTGMLLEPRLGVVRVADAIVMAACPQQSPECISRALLLWTQQEILYRDALLSRDYIPSPEETIILREGDSRSLSILLASFLRSQNIDSRVGYSSTSAFTQTRLNGTWVGLDPSCASCSVGSTRLDGTTQEVSWVE